MPAPSSPQRHDPSTPVNQVVFLNFMKLIHRGVVDVEEANRQLDLLDFDPSWRFWGCNTVYSDGRSYHHYIKWENGSWANGSRDHTEQVRAIREGKA